MWNGKYVRGTVTTNLKNYLDISDDGDWCHDQIWGDMWIGTDDNGCCTDQV
jgi:hypothetical protein